MPATSRCGRANPTSGRCSGRARCRSAGPRGVPSPSVEAAVTERTIAIEVVHLYGLPADMPEILDIARRHGLAVWEDCAQAHAAAIDDKPVGTFGAWGSFLLIICNKFHLYK